MKVRGLTILEVMLAMGLLAISVLLILGVLARFLTSQSSTAAQTAARLIAKEILDQAAAVGPATWGLATPDLTGTRTLTLPNEKKPTEFRYQLYPSPLRADPRDQGTLWELEVEVKWWSDDSRAERGNLYWKAQRVVYVEN